MYNVRQQLTDQPHEDGIRNGSDEMGAFGKLLLSIPGIELVRVQPYRFIVSKAVMFDWSEIEPKVIELVSHFEQHAKLLESV